MNIQNVKKTRSGFDADINGSRQYGITEHSLFWSSIQNWLIKKSNVPEPEFTKAELDKQLIAKADRFVILEMDIADKAINAHDEGASRVISTKTKWINYKNKLRDYVQLVSGIRKIIISKPTRPS